MCSWHQVCAPAQGQPAEPRNAHAEAGLICTWVPGPVLCRPVHAPPGAPGQLSLVERLVLDPVAPEACTPGQGKEEARGSTLSARRQRLHPPRVLWLVLESKGAQSLQALSPETVRGIKAKGAPRVDSPRSWGGHVGFLEEQNPRRTTGSVAVRRDAAAGP